MDSKNLVLILFILGFWFFVSRSTEKRVIFTVPKIPDIKDSIQGDGGYKV